MTNEEIIFKAKEECKLRGLSHHTQAEYLVLPLDYLLPQIIYSVNKVCIVF